MRAAVEESLLNDKPFNLIRILGYSGQTFGVFLYFVDIRITVPVFLQDTGFVESEARILKAPGLRVIYLKICSFQNLLYT